MLVCEWKELQTSVGLQENKLLNSLGEFILRQNKWTTVQDAGWNAIKDCSSVSGLFATSDEVGTSRLLSMLHKPLVL